MCTTKFLLQPPSGLLILIQDGIVQPRLRICVARRVHKKRKIAVKSTDNVAESRTNQGAFERG